MNEDRLDWDEYFLEVCKAVALRADCTRSKVGSVLVDRNHRIVGTGYNGAPSGSPGCLSGACPRGRLSYEELPPESDYGNCIANHSEYNAVVYALPEERSGSTLYVTRRPCVLCKELLLAEGVTRVVWLSQDNIKCTELLFE
jgi:dCMP deaminase